MKIEIIAPRSYEHKVLDLGTEPFEMAMAVLIGEEDGWELRHVVPVIKPAPMYGGMTVMTQVLGFFRREKK